MKSFNVADADIAERVAVIGAVQREIARLVRPRSRALPPVLKRHLERHFHRRGAVVGVENVVQAWWRQFDQPPRQSNGRHVAES